MDEQREALKWRLLARELKEKQAAVTAPGYWGAIPVWQGISSSPPPAMEEMTKYFDFMDNLLGVQSTGRFLMQAAGTIRLMESDPMPTPRMLLRSRAVKKQLWRVR